MRTLALQEQQAEREQRVQKEREDATRAEKIRREAATHEEEIQLVRNSFSAQVTTLYNAQVQGRVWAKVLRNQDQSPRYLKWCELCFTFIGAQQHYRESLLNQSLHKNVTVNAI